MITLETRSGDLYQRVDLLQASEGIPPAALDALQAAADLIRQAGGDY